MLKRKFKRAYVSIEVVILASIVIIGGMAGLSAFLKNGQGAQAQSADMINNTIDMIGEEFDFDIGGGELPGGEETGDSGEENGELNEYGFYYGKKYYAEQTFNGFALSYAYIFNENGSVDIINTGLEPSGTLVYEQDKALINGGIAYTFTLNGTKVSSSAGYDFSLDGTPATALNEYGFYFNEEYIGDVDGVNTTIVFYENGSDLQTMKGVVFMTYEQSKVFDEGELFGSFSENGKEFNSIAEGIVLTLIE